MELEDTSKYFWGRVNVTFEETSCDPQNHYLKQAVSLN